MALDLSNRTWPVRPGDDPELDKNSPYLHYAVFNHHNSFVHEGSMVALRPEFPGITTPVPADESAIVSMTVDSFGRVLCGTAVTEGQVLRKGAGAHLLVGMTRGVTGLVHDLGIVPDARAVTSVMASPDRTVYVTTTGNGTGAIYKHSAIPLPFDCLQEWGFSRPGFEKVATPFEDEGISCAVMDKAGRFIYGVSDRLGNFFAYDIETGELTTEKVDGIKRFSRVIIMDTEGDVWGTAAGGTLWKYSTTERHITNTGIRIPAASGREVHNHAESFALDPFTGIIYGSGSSDGYLFAFNPRTQELKNLGKPGASPTIRCMSVDNTGRLFGIYGGAEDIGHLFCYDPEEGAFSDIGVPLSLFGVRTYGYVFGCAATGPDGEIYFGQTERNSHLWIYYPAIKPRKAVQPAGETQ